MKNIKQNLEKYISEQDIYKRVKEISNEIASLYHDKNPILIGILNGSFIFLSDLIRHLNIDCEVDFIKISSYVGKKSSGRIDISKGLDLNIKNRSVIIVEDIVDTGNTIYSVIEEIKNHKPESVEVATLLFKRNAYQKKLPINYAAINVGNEFLVGFGLDYNGIGRNLEDIFIIEENS